MQILEALRLSGALGSSLSGSSEKGTMTPTKTTALPKTESIPPAPKSPGPFSFIKKSDSLQSSPSAASAEVAQVRVHHLTSFVPEYQGIRPS